MTVPNEDNGSPVVRGQFNNGLQHMDGFSHIAYCAGPFQLAFLLSALDVCGISLGKCTILPFPGSARNDDLKKNLVTVCSHLGMQIADLDPMLLPTLSDARHLRGPVSSRPRVAYWYCQGRPYSGSVLNYLRKIMPDIVFEYYDGLGSHTAAFEQEKRHLSLSDTSGFGDLRQLAIQRLMRPDMHLMPEDGLWQKSAPLHSQAKTRYVSLSVMLRNIRLVGKILDDISGDPWPLRKGPAIILLPSRFSELRPPVDSASLAENELRMHDDLLGIVRSVSKTASILVKAHPRTGAETVRRLQEICAKHDAQLYYRQQLVEYILDRSRRRDVLVIGLDWSTSLVNTILFGWGQSVGLSKGLIASYIGQENVRDSTMAGLHLLSETGVTVMDSLADLSEFLREQVPR
jgi:hypothetical protein